MAKKSDCESDCFYEVINHEAVCGPKWKEFARHSTGLNLSLKDVENITFEYRFDGESEIRYQMLLKWKLINGNEATPKRLMSILNSYINKVATSIRGNEHPEGDEQADDNIDDGIRITSNNISNPEIRPMQHQDNMTVQNNNEINASESANRAFQEDDINTEYCERAAENPQLSATPYPTFVPSDMYSVARRCKGKVLIINNSFKYSPWYREGSEKDVKNMQQLWTRLNFEVIVKTNLKADDIIPTIKSFICDLTKDDIPVLFLMSHGKKATNFDYQRDLFLGEDAGEVRVVDIINLFKGNALQKMVGRPKLFFFQMCRGDNCKPGIQLDNMNRDPSPTIEDHSDAMRFDSLPESADLFLFHATQEGEKAFRNASGSWFINAVFNVFSNYAATEHVGDMMVRVNKIVAKKTSTCPSVPEEHGMKEMSESTITATKKLHLCLA